MSPYNYLSRRVLANSMCKCVCVCVALQALEEAKACKEAQMALMETADQKTDLLKTTVTAFRDRRGKADWVSINEDGGYELGADPCQDKDVCKRIVEFLVKSIRASEVGHVCTLIMKMQRIHVYVQDPRFDKLVPWLRFMFQSCLERKMPIVVPKKVRILTLLVFI